MRKELIIPVSMISFGFLLLGVTILKSNFTPLGYQISYFFCGGLFGAGISLLSYKAENLRKFSTERAMKEFIKLVLSFVIIFTPVYVVPFYYLYTIDTATNTELALLLLYASGIMLVGGTVTLILNFQKRDIPEPTVETKIISKFFIIIATSLALLATGFGIIYSFYPTNLAILGAILILIGIVLLIYARKIKNIIYT